MTNHETCQPIGQTPQPTLPTQANEPSKGQQQPGRLINGLLGMAAEILFSLGLVLVGFLISLLGGW